MIFGALTLVATHFFSLLVSLVLISTIFFASGIFVRYVLHIEVLGGAAIGRPNTYIFIGIVFLLVILLVAYQFNIPWS